MKHWLLLVPPRLWHFVPVLGGVRATNGPRNRVHAHMSTLDNPASAGELCRDPSTKFIPATARGQHNKAVLMFDVSGGVLSSQCIMLEQRPHKSEIPFSSPMRTSGTRTLQMTGTVPVQSEFEFGRPIDQSTPWHDDAAVVL